MRDLNGEEQLAVAAARLKGTDPQGFDEFLRAFASMTEEVQDNCISSPLDTLPTTQGRAQMMLRLRKVFATCRDTAEKIGRTK